MSEKRIPQNIISLISEIGERMVLFKLYEHTQNLHDLHIYKNYSDSGYDIGVINTKKNTRRKTRIEVKTRQRSITRSKTDNSAHFLLTQNEYDNCDFLVAYWLEKNYFFIVPVDKFQAVKIKKVFGYRFIASVLKDNGLNESSRNWLDRWELIIKHAK